MYWISQELSLRKINVKVISTDNGLDGEYTPNIWHNINGIHVIYCSSRLKFFREFFRELGQASVIHLNSIFYWRNLLCHSISLIFKKNTIWSVRGELHDSAINNRKFVKKIVLVLVRLCSGKVRFHGTSIEELQLITEIFPKNISFLIPNYIPVKSKEHYEKKAKVLYLGRLNKIKNIEFLIEVFTKCLFREEVELIIAGRGDESYVKELKDQVPNGYEEKVIFIGEIKGSDKDKLIAESAILALPSFSENFGNVVIEALSLGTPVVCSVNTPWEQLANFNCGYHLELVESEWIKVLQFHMNHLESTEIGDMSSRAFEFCNTHFNIKSGVKDWINAYGRQDHQ